MLRYFTANASLVVEHHLSEHYSVEWLVVL